MDLFDHARGQYLEATIFLPEYLLSSQGDRMAMAHSVEGRYPFLDHRVVEFAAKLPARVKMKVLDEKHILKRAVADLIPESVTRRKKQPYRAPDAVSLLGEPESGDRPRWAPPRSRSSFRSRVCGAGSTPRRPGTSWSNEWVGFRSTAFTISSVSMGSVCCWCS